MRMLLLFLALSHYNASVNAQSGSDSVPYTVNVMNEGTTPIEVYFFEQPAIFDNAEGVYSNSLGHQTVQPLKRSQAKFTIEYSLYAAAQRLDRPITEVQSTSIALVPIRPKTNRSPGQTTMMSFDNNQEPVLSAASSAIAVGATGAAAVMVDGSFHIDTPRYPEGQGEYAIGLGVKANGEYHMSTHTIAKPGQVFNVQPVRKFYVRIGRVEKGKDVNFYSVSTAAALCDASKGKRTFNVVRTNDGGWKVDGKMQD